LKRAAGLACGHFPSFQPGTNHACQRRIKNADLFCHFLFDGFQFPQFMACRMDFNNRRHAGTIPPMQMIHRPSLSRVVRRAVFMALKGVLPLLPLLLAVSCKRQPESAIPSVSEKLIIPGHGGAYTGAYIDFGDNEDDVTPEAIDDFEKLTGKHQAIIASSSYWGEQTFPTDSVDLIQQHGSIPLIYWSPWDLPYEEGNGPDRFSLENILAGKWDAYIDAWAASAKEFGHPLFVSFAKEPNGSGYPWSGMYCGGDKIVPGASSNQGANTPAPTPPHAESPTPPNLTFDEVTSGPPDEFEGPETYKKAYRYVVDRVRAKGASNIIWVFQVMNFSTPQDDWNYAAQYYPGAAYVDWIGLSVCGQQYPEDQWSAFTPLFKQPYAEVCRLDPAKPIMLAEWRCGEFPKSGSKSAFITEAFETMKADYPRLKAAVFWHEQWQNDDNSTSDLRVNSSPESLDAYRKGVADPFWLDRPVYSK
jgi:hypothetical protein